MATYKIFQCESKNYLPRALSWWVNRENSNSPYFIEDVEVTMLKSSEVKVSASDDYDTTRKFTRPTAEVVTTIIEALGKDAVWDDPIGSVERNIQESIETSEAFFHTFGDNKYVELLMKGYNKVSGTFIAFVMEIKQ